ncbi:MAG TPA: glycosyltransferase family 39 protein [Candidatus Didemnitutus sp.]|nr:glycosyltransferase family 39 protein [Candidatus Didemnitutus sp.]
MAVSVPNLSPADRPRWLVPAVIAILVAHVALALWGASHESVTHDELLHLTGGYFYDKFADFRIQPENGNLPQRLAGLPAVLMHAPTPELEHNRFWATSDASVMGHQLFYETNHDHWPMLMAGRSVMMVFSLGTALLVFAWARWLFGSLAGVLALTLYAFDPNVLAHAPLATSDSAAVFFLLASCTAFWWFLGSPSAGRALGSGLVFGLACVAKYSAVMLLPMFLLLAVWRLLRVASGQRLAWTGRTIAGFATHGVLAVVVIWTFFDFRYSGFGPTVPAADHYILPWESVLPNIGFQGKVVEFCRKGHLLPEAFLYGYSWVIQSAQARASFLHGEYGIFGWPSFFPLAFLWKTPTALLVAMAVGLGVVVRRKPNPAGGWEADLEKVAPLLVLFVVYWVFSLTSHLNIGHRHILPTYPTLFILVSGLVAPGIFRGARRWAIAAALGLGTLAANAWVAPHYLAFFNVWAGGPSNGYRLLADSSLDWGQDLPGLAQWLTKHNSGDHRLPVFISYFGTGEPDYYHIDAVRLPFVNGFKIRPKWSEPTGGIYCISATMLDEVYSPVRGDYDAAMEQEYQNRRKALPLFRDYFSNPAARAKLVVDFKEQDLEAAWVRLDLLRFARLTAYLRARKPDAMIGYSILIYRLTDDEVNRVLNRRYSEWSAAVAGAAGS